LKYINHISPPHPHSYTPKGWFERAFQIVCQAGASRARYRQSSFAALECTASDNLEKWVCFLGSFS